MTRPDVDACTPRPRSKAVPRGLLLLSSTLVTLLGLELGMRFVNGAGLSSLPDPVGGLSMIGHIYPGSFDPDLGYVPTPGARAANPIWMTTAHITLQGTRSNGLSAPVPPGVPVVVVGDSFTYGDEVGDRDTWPAALERMVGRPVINGGVFGYGFDQAVLRSEGLLEQFDADYLVASLITDDVNRCEYSYRYSWKPYFDVVEGKLVRYNSPAPSPDQLPPGEDPLRRVLRRSFLADFVLRRIDPNDWIVRGSVRVHDRGEEVSRLLLDRLADAAQARGHGLLVVVQWQPGTTSKRAQPLIDRARERGVDLLSIEEPLRRAIDSRGFSQENFFNVRELPGRNKQVGHMSAEGNAFVARAIAEHLAGKL